jgi:hypothetical protein
VRVFISASGTIRETEQLKSEFKHLTREGRPRSLRPALYHRC